MKNFQNLVQRHEPETTMFPQETEALLRVINTVLERFAPSATKGTFILDGQKFGEDAQCILRLNLSDGPYQRRLFGIYGRTSDEMAAAAIDELLALPEKSRYYSEGSLPRHMTHEDIKTAQDVSSGIYQDAELVVLVLNATHGRFLISCYIEDHDDVAEALLCAVAQAILRMGLEDKVLQSFGEQLADASKVNAAPCAEALNAVKELFDHCDAPELAAWKAWHEPANATGKLTLFFE